MSDLVLDEYNTPNSPGMEPSPNSMLINGAGQAACEGRDGCLYAVLPARAGSCDKPKTKIRIINTSGFGPFNMTIDDHYMMVGSIWAYTNTAAGAALPGNASMQERCMHTCTL